jgi:hypothetical protein
MPTSFARTTLLTSDNIHQDARSRDNRGLGIVPKRADTSTWGIAPNCRTAMIGAASVEHSA